MASGDLITFAVAIVICTASVAAAAGHLLRSRPKDRLLLSFALFAGIYGVRMFFRQPLAGALGIGTMPARWVESTLNYFVLVPAMLFTEDFYGLGWRRSLRRVTIAISAFAFVALAVDIAAGDPYRVPEPALLMLTAIAAVVVAGVLTGYAIPPFAEWRALALGMAVFTLLVLNEHAVLAGLVPWRVRIEPIGFLVLLTCLGYIALTRVVAQGRELVAVAQEMRSAREIQQSILPRRLPATPTLEMTARYVPLAAVAGDFYDVVPLRDGEVAVLIADVSGHGVPAALIASMVKVAFLAELGQTDDPGAILGKMNATLCGMFDRSFVTAACVVLRPDEASMAYAIAGHPPPLVLPAGNGHVVPLDESGVVLGFLPSAGYKTSTMTIEPGTRLILYTDGVIETADASDDLYGIDRLRAFSEAERHRSPSSFADALLASLDRFAGSLASRQDDVTLLVVDVSRAGAPPPV